MTTAAIGYIVAAFWSRKNLEQILRQYPLVDADGAGTSSLFYSQMELTME
ncbi:cytosine-specific methyltransferase, partial [Trifolium medium]|nr:cytosine-specific methyltransferase [Trifolium medium]